MANWNVLKTAIAQVIKTNGNKEITGQIMQDALNSIISNVGANATFKGIAIPTTNPVAEDGYVFYLANTVGTYVNFNGIEVVDKLTIITNTSGEWTGISLNYLTNVVDNKVSKTGAETINGVKTFNVPPIVPTATEATEAINKGQLDTAIAFKPTTAQGNVLFAGATNNILGDLNLFWDNAQKYFGIGTNTPTSPLEIKTISALESAPLSAEILTSLGWTSIGWTGDFANGFSHTPGNTNILSILPSLILNNKYQIEVTVTNLTAGSFKINFGGYIGFISYTSNGVKNQGDTAIDITKGLEIVPTSDFNGTVKISLKRITGIYGSTLLIRNSAGTSNIHLRSSKFFSNCIIGFEACGYNTTGEIITAIGANAARSNTTGNNFTAIGNNSALSNTIGFNFAAIGVNAAYNNTTGYNFAAIGFGAAYFNKIGNNFVSIGASSGYNNISGNSWVNIGTEAGYYGVTNSFSVGIGQAALFNAGRTINATSTIVGLTYTIQSLGNTDFTLIGAATNAVGVVFTATGIGTGTGTVSHNSDSNVAIGANAGRNYTGAVAMNQVRSSIFIGTDTRAKAEGSTNEIVIGTGVTGNGNNTTTIGGAANTGTFFKSVYAELYAADNVTAQAIPTGATYTKINQFTTAGQTNASWVTASAANDNLIIIKPGRYKIEATSSTKSGTANVLLKTAIFVGGVKAPNIQAERKIMTANDSSLISIGGIINVTAANTEIDVRVAHDNAGSVNITCVHCNLNLTYISE